MVAGPATSAMAAPTDRSEALGRFLGGEALGIDLDTLAAVRGALEQNPSGNHPAGPTANPLTAEVLSTLGVNLDGTLQLFGPNGIIQLGAAAQYAEAADNGDAVAASGAVSDQGGISLGGAGTPPSDARISLTPVLGSVPGAGAAVSQLDVQLGALGSIASQTQGAPVVSDYLIADARLDLTSPLVGSTVSGTVNALQATVNSVEGLLETALGARLNVRGLATATADVDIAEPNLQALLPTAFTSTTTPGVTLDLQTGQVSVDVDTVLAANGLDINDLPPNSPLLSGATGDAIARAVLTTLIEAVDQVEANLITTVRSLAVTGKVAVTVDLPLLPDVVVGVALGGTLNDITVTTTGATGAVLGLLNVDSLVNLAVDGVLSGVVEPALALVSTTLNGVAAGLPTAVVDPILDVVESVVLIRANVQPQAGDLGTGSFTVRAVDVQVLPGSGLATVNLASSTVRGTAYVAPAPAIALTPSTVTAGGSTTVTGSGFTPGESVTVRLPNINGGPAPTVTTAAAPDGTISVILPVPAAYPVGLAGVVATGAQSNRPAAAELTVTAPASDPAITLDPATISVGGTTTVSGTGFAPAEAVTVSLPAAGGAAPSVTVTATPEGTISIPLTVPAGYPGGTVDVTARGVVSADPATAALTVTAITYTPTITVDPATVIAGDDVTVTGGGFAAGETVTVSIPGADGGDRISEDVTAGTDGTITATLPVPEDYPAGDVDVTAVGPVSNAPASADLTVDAPVVYAPAITLDPATIVAGGSTTVTGTGFAPGETVEVSIPRAGDGAPISVGVTAGPDGDITATVPVPADYVPGNVTVTALGEVSDTPATAELTVTYEPGITLDPATLVAGGSTTVTGTGFAPGETVEVSIPGVNNGDPISVDVTAAADGGIEAVLVVPSGYPFGGVVVTAKGQVSKTPMTADLAVTYDPAITLDPAIVVAGDDVTVTGDGFAADETVTVSIPGANGGARIEVEVGADAEGTISATLPVPADYPAGTVDVTALGGVSETAATADLEVVYRPTVTVPERIVAGDRIPVTGSGFVPGEIVAVSLPDAAGTPITVEVSADRYGAITATLLVPGNYPAGAADVTATGEVSGVPVTDRLTVVYEPSVTVPEVVVAGGGIAVDGEGFASGETVVVSIPGANGGAPIEIRTTADADGGITTTLPVPTDYPLGPVDVTVVGNVSRTPVTEEVLVEEPATTYTPGIGLEPATVVPGGTTTVTGEGFAPGETVTVSLPGVGGTPIQVEETADGDGAIDVGVTVPGNYPVGPVDVTVVGDISKTPVTGELMVEEPDVVYTPVIAVDPSTVVAGGSTTVTGTGFAAGETVTVSLPGVDGGAPVSVSTTAGPDGVITANLRVPANYPAGDVTVTALGTVSKAGGNDDLVVVYETSITAAETVIAGDSTTVTGAGFAPGETVTVSLPGVDGGAPVSVSTTAGPDGVITANLRVPANYPAGDVTVTALGAVSKTAATDDLSVAYEPSITAPRTVLAGSDVTVIGGGFAPGETVTVSIPGFDGGADILVQVTAGSDGTISATLAVPGAYPAGDVTVTALGTASKTAATHELSVTYRTTITVPGTVTAGDDIAVTGGGFAPGETVTVSIPGAAQGDALIDVEVTAGADGTITANLQVPGNYPAGTVDVTARGAVSATPATADLTVDYETAITVDPATVVAGSSTTVTGDGFAAGETVTVSIPGVNGGQAISVSTTANDDGEISATLLVPGTYPAGDVVVTARGAVSDAEATTVLAVTYETAITLDPATVVAGSSTTVTGDGFAAGETVTVSIPGVNGGQAISVDVTANDDGGIDAIIVVPGGYVPGTVTVTALGAVSKTEATTELAVTYDPTITVDPATVVAGSSTTVTGVGFAAGETVTLSIPGVNGGAPISGTTTANDDGEITATLLVPGTYPAGDVVVTARGVVSATAVTAGFEITYRTAITVPATVAAGGDLGVSGTGFAAGETVTLSIPGVNGGPAVSGTTTANGDGEIIATLTVPGDYPAGDVVVTARGAVSRVAATDTTAVTYDPTITVPATVVAGDGITVTGDGFAPGETVTVSIPGVDGDEQISVGTTAGAEGTITVTVPVPADYPAGAVEITAVGAVSGTPVSGDLAVIYTPLITLDPSTVVAGGSTTVTGGGFAPGETVRVSIPGVDGGDPIEVEVPADEDGAIDVDITVPGGYPAGPVEVTVAGDISDTPVTEELTVEEIDDAYTPSITLDPSTVVAGGSTTVTGGGFAPGETVEVSIPGVDGGDPILVEDIADGEGAIEAVLEVPAGYPAGPVDITVIGDISDTPVVEELAVVYQPVVTVPGTVASGENLPVTGGGFAPKETVTVSIPGVGGGDPIEVEVEADEDGAIDVGITVPGGYPAGPVDVTVVGDVSKTPVVEEIAVVHQPSITLDPSTVVAGSSTTVTGTGFAAGETVTVSIPGMNGGAPISVSTTADADGTIEVALPVPAGYPAGTLTVTALGEVSDEEATAGLSVTYDTAISLTENEVTAGDDVTVTGTGFAPGETVTVSIPGTSEGDERISVTVTAAPDGTIRATLPVPDGYPQRDLVVTALGDISDTPATAELTIDTEGEGDEAAPDIIVDPGTAAPGDTVVVIGDGFTPGGTITVSLGCGGVATVVSDGEGSFSVEVTVPQDCPPGPTTVTADEDASDEAATVVLVIASSGDVTPGTDSGTDTGTDTGAGTDGGNIGGNNRGGDLASTGTSGLFALIGVALAVLVAGGAVLASSRSRRG
ncbi:choice-of-anchor G family protein [Arthrobacter sp. Soc17.1.1.1]|uniref:choice-of-anchor G family protein n=1 Tax=Arthrobacter sp. Soc17.1.1.1 TaxID=3121277 RepID=UPI002FE4A2F1